VATLHPWPPSLTPNSHLSFTPGWPMLTLHPGIHAGMPGRPFHLQAMPTPRGLQLRSAVRR